jgi:hypothetical protein
MGRRLPAASRRTTPPSSPTAPPREGTMGDNQFGDEASRIQLISIVSKLSAADDAIEIAKAPLEAAQAHRKTIIGLGKAAGFSANELKERLKEMKTPTREMAKKVEREGKHRRWLGIVEPEQSDLMLGDRAPQETKDEAHWAGEGYKAGLRQMAAKAPPECGPRFDQIYLKAHERGLNEVLMANAPKPMKPSVRDQAAADFAVDEPEVDIAKAAKKLKNDPAFMATGGPDAVETAVAPTDPAPDDGFEATPEELEQQGARRAAREAAAANDEPEEVL